MKILKGLLVTIGIICCIIFGLWFSGWVGYNILRILKPDIVPQGFWDYVKLGLWIGFLK